MKRSIIFILTLITVFSFSCKKNSDETPSPNPDYYALKVGNYWIYQSFVANPGDTMSPTNYFDSSYVEKDTLIRGSKYFKIWQGIDQHYSTKLPNYLRDSSGYLVNSNGYIICSDKNFRDTLVIDSSNKIICMKYIMMTGKDSVVTVPAGSFTSITSRAKIVPTRPDDPYPPRYSYIVYGKNTGKIKSHSFYYNGDLHFESRLVRYKVQ